MEVEFKGKLRLSGMVTTCTGVAIGKNSLGAGKSSLPRATVRHPLNNLPFIPASVFRGSVRRLLEQKYSTTAPDGQKIADAKVGDIFVGSKVKNGRLSARATFRDLFLSDSSAKQLMELNQQSYLTDIKVYASMDRVTSQGNAYAIEQIPAGAQFQFEIIYSVYQQEDFATFTRLLEGLHDLEKSSLGAHGSRGLGKIKFGLWPLTEQLCLGSECAQGLELTWRAKDYYESGAAARCLITGDEKLSLENFIAQYEQQLGELGQ